MKNSKQSIVEKFKKKDRICNICQLEKELSEDHVPPQACPPAKNTVISKLFYQMIGDRSFRPRMSQKGVSYKTICSDCNNKLGNRYDWALGDFSQKIESFIGSSVILPDSFEVECYPNAIMRSVLGHLLAAKTQTDEVVVDTIIRPCILDPSLPIPDEIHIFYWVYPYETISILRDFAMPAVRGNLQTSGFFNMIKFYPIAFLITHQLPSYEKLLSLDKFNQLPSGDKANLQIDLRPIKRSTWPEECLGEENFLLVGRAANDSVYAVPKLNKIKNRS
ncbi:hypothetical protein NIES4072_64270 [Nostoc commune NIES-4072]|uniref:HNH endonuclease 5 domain-containing protein n=1 Tax=Nostoc commune NIES-4072 TaxID=2005467 RepID=A0A2R5FWQ3_NOSCO|nr:hypothetical protein [Nostoc commune]BBD70047.1 hypothetical protein NIES4070_64580 [Nostoc commune HK-02]GBG22715.1 hypothetical protein NIES4072_64270 [Nostoc commune NIES-4072]